MLKLSTLLCLLPSLALAQTSTYVIEPTLAACQTRSQSQCTSLGCDGSLTKYWWSCVGPLQAGTVGATVVLNTNYALEVMGSPPYGVTTTNKVTTAGLTVPEQTAAKTAVAMGTVLPVGFVAP